MNQPDEYGLKLTTKRRRIEHETDMGVYLWRVKVVAGGNDQYIGDGDGHFLMIRAKYGDETAKRKLAKEAAACGVDEGEPVFFPGHRPVTDEEFDEQRMRFELGLQPDPLQETNRVS